MMSETKNINKTTNTAKYEEKEVCETNELFNMILDIDDDTGFYQKFIYRGVGSSEYELIPSLLRDKFVEKDKVSNREAITDAVSKEYEALRQFHNLLNTQGEYVPSILFFEAFTYDIIKKNNYFDGKISQEQKYEIDMAYRELAAIAQHYDIPTRMLDWSRSPLVALYFACTSHMKLLLNENANENKDYFSLWQLNTRDVNGYYSNQQYNNNDDEIKLRFIYPKYMTNQNLCAQQGVLTYIGASLFSNSSTKDNEPLDKFIMNKIKNPSVLMKYNILSSLVVEIYNKLKIIGVSGTSLFLGKYGAVKQFKDDELADRIEKKIQQKENNNGK